MKKNRVIYPFLLTLLVVAGLAALQMLPPLQVGAYALRPVALLSDVIPQEEDTLSFDMDSMLVAAVDTAAVTEMKHKKIEVIAPPGTVAIEDFSDLAPDTTLGDRHGMAHFYEVLANRQQLGRPVRIAYYGDSFIEGDLMTSDLRSKLQSAYGGCGVGFVDIDSPTAGFRGSVRTYSQNWSSHSATDKGGFSASKQGIAERYFISRGEASLRIQGIKNRAMHQDTCQQSTLFFRSEEPITITARINRGEPEYFYPEGSSKVQSLTVNGNIGQVQWFVPDSLQGVFFGATMDGEQGIVLDNFSLRGSSGTTLKAMPKGTLHDFSELREYDLIVFQFGLNVASNNVKDYSHYTKQMADVIRKYAVAYPNASILIVGMSDRGERQDGEVVSMPCVRYLNHFQRLLAMQTGVCYWNLFEAMGGEGSMGRMVDEDKPAKANKDYTHINAFGGRFVAGLLFDAIQAGKDFYDEGRNAE